MKDKQFSFFVKHCIFFSVYISLILTWCRMRKVSKDVEDVVSKLCHGSSMQVVDKELGLFQSYIRESSDNA